MPVNTFPRSLVRQYVKSNFNATQAYLALRPNSSVEAARVSAHRVLMSDNGQSAMAEIIDEIATPEEVKSVLSEYMRDRDPKVRASSVRAGEIVGKIHGLIQDGARIQVNIGLGQLDQAAMAALASLETPQAIGEGRSELPAPETQG